ncbi:hypothetical protein [uncultured Paludibaculum sp.]|uniref:hypothetical protein n=1 Tax=uncultured Paludibaculum sp. TaxID=1765020 RepID=UPI002AAB7425|nr:hypothetical protein [uncultured Paludibaculum sp.]
MKLLTAGSKDHQIISTSYGYRHMWNMITFSELLVFNLLCMPFLANGRVWTVVLEGRKKNDR